MDLYKRIDGKFVKCEENIFFSYDAAQQSYTLNANIHVVLDNKSYYLAQKDLEDYMNPKGLTVQTTSPFINMETLIEYGFLRGNDKFSINMEIINYTNHSSKSDVYEDDGVFLIDLHEINQKIADLETQKIGDLRNSSDLKKVKSKHFIYHKNNVVANGIIKKENTKIILQREFSVSTAKSKKPILLTTGASTCCIIAIYNPIDKIAVLGHMDDATYTSSLSQMIIQSKVKNNREKAVVYLSGGYKTMGKLYHYMQNSEFKNIIIDPNESEYDHEHARSLAIDARNGNIMNFNMETARNRLQTASLMDRLNKFTLHYRMPSKAIFVEKD